MTTSNELIPVPKPEYQWQYFSSLGHAYFEKTAALRLRSNLMFRLAIALVLATALALYLVSKASGVTGSMAGWVAGKGQQLFSAGTPTTNLAPPISLPLPLVPLRGQAQVPFANFTTDVTGEMQRLAREFDGELPVGCLSTTRLTDPWWTSAEATPRCRLSSDKSRLWIWAVVEVANGNPASYVGLVRRSDGDNTLFNVPIGYTGLQIAGAKSLDPFHIPRALAADFPELSGGAK